MESLGLRRMPDGGTKWQAPEIHAYRANLATYGLRIAVHAVPAIVIGLVVDKIFKNLQEKYNLKPLTVIVLQIIVLIVILFLLERASQHYANEWQSNTPGFFFVSFVFGTQFNLFTNLAALSKQVTGEQ